MPGIEEDTKNVGLYKSVNGVEVKMTSQEIEAYQKWKDEKDEEEKQYEPIRNRLNEYGSLLSQIEFITENGLDAWQSKVTEIKAKYPKP